MIPSIEILETNLTETEYPTRTYKIDYLNDRIIGFVDGLDAVKQAVYLILNSERYRHLIYSWDYGAELFDLFGQPLPYVISEIERRIREALVQDSRIDSVQNFSYEKHGDKLHVTFEVITNLGTVQAETEVTV